MQVYFDNLTINHYSGPLSETTDYTAWGLEMKMLSSKAFGRLENKLKYNGKEEQKKEFSDGSGLEWLDYGARMYDNQIGRWMILDLLSEKFTNLSAYSFCFNNPIIFIDPDGNEPVKSEATGVTAMIDLLRQAKVNSLTSLRKYFGSGYNGSHKNASSAGKYLYSEKWGWADMKHVSYAANKTDSWWYSGGDVLGQGEEIEYMQDHELWPADNKKSSWDYEDLVSNLIGVGFESYLESDEASGKDFLDNLKTYLVDLGFQDDPSKATNWKDVPEDYSGEKDIQNYTYDPMFAPKKNDRKSAADKLLFAILKKFDIAETENKKKALEKEKAERFPNTKK